MPCTITRLLTCLGDTLVAGRLDQVTRHFTYPLPLYVNDDLVVFGTADTLAEGLSMYRDAILAIGTASLRPRVVAQGLPVRGVSSVWVEWDPLDANGTCLRSNQVRYATHQAATDLFPRVEMIDYTVTAFPELSHALPATRTA